MSQPDTLELHVAELRQLFNAMDPAPFRERDLDPNAEKYIVDWARDSRSRGPFTLLVYLGGGAATPANRSLLRDAVDQHFRQRAVSTRQQLRQLFRTGRISLVIGLAFVALATLAADYFGDRFASGGTGAFVIESLVIGSWVALWRPMHIFLYDWWPILADARLLDRLGAMDVRLADAPAPSRQA